MKYAPYTGPTPRIKTIIISLAVWGVLPAEAAEWLIRRGGLRHA